jgi:hypothetical protein
MPLTKLEREEIIHEINSRTRRGTLEPGSVSADELASGSVTRAKLAAGVLMPQAGAYVVGQHYALTTQPAAFALSGTALVALTSLVYPWVAPRTWTPAALGVYVTTEAALSTTKVLIYTHDDATGWPAAKSYESASLDTGAGSLNTFVSTAASMPTFTAGTTYWVGMISTGTPSLRSQTTVANSILNHLATVGATTMSHRLERAGETYATPTTPWGFAATQLATGNNPIVIALA